MHKLALLLFIFLLSSCKESSTQYNGYIDADLTYISSDFAGRLTSLLVRRGQTVHKEQPLFHLEQTSESLAVKVSQFSKDSLLSQRAGILDQIQYAEKNYTRTFNMRKQSAASQNDLEATKRDLEVLRNQLKALDFQIKGSQADIANKNWQKSQKNGYAPDSGIIFDTFFSKGEYLQAGQPVLALITKKQIKVIFFLPEQKLSEVPLNAKIRVSSDGSPQLATGVVQYISPIAQYTPPILYSREERKNLVFRVEASIDKPDLAQLHLGQPVTLEIIR